MRIRHHLSTVSRMRFWRDWFRTGGSIQTPASYPYVDHASVMEQTLGLAAVQFEKHQASLATAGVIDLS